MSRLPKTRVSTSVTRKSVPKTKSNINKVIFSFEQFMCKSIKNKEFNNCFTNCWEYSKWSLSLFDRFKSYSTMEVTSLKESGKGARCHIVEGKALLRLLMVLECLGITINEQLSEDGMWELSLGAANGRVFGYFIDNIFYILLFDPHHLIYPDFTYGAHQDLLYRNYDPWSEIAN